MRISHHFFFFGFDHKRNLCIHDDVCMYVCMCVCVRECVCVYVSLWHFLLIRYLKKGNSDSSQTWYIDAPYWQKEPYCFWWRSKVIWGHQRSNSENIVNTISQVRKGGLSSYLVFRCIMVGRKTLWFLVEVKGHLGSPGVKPWKLLLHDILR